MATGGIDDSRNPWPRVGTCEVCGRQNTVLHEAPNGKWCCADEHLCLSLWSEARRRGGLR